MTKPFLPYLETMISNACTLACQNCTNYSDYHMKGSLRYADFEPVLDAWNERIEIDCMGFIGGEPMINPELKTFMRETQRKLKKSVMLVTNATLWHRWPNFIDFVKDMGSVHLKFSVHQPSEEYIHNAIKDVMDNVAWEPVTVTRDFKQFKNDDYSLMFTIDSHNRFIRTWRGTNYYDMKPYNNDPVEAYKRCQQKSCPLLYKGRLYKCSSIALLEQVLSDHFLINDTDWKPYLDYNGVGIEDSDSDIQAWIDNYKKPNSICRMCPTFEDQPFYTHWDKVKTK